MKLSPPQLLLRVPKQHILRIRPLTASLANRTRSTPLQTRTFTVTTIFKMASFSNTDTGSKNPDPYKEKNKDETSIKEKVEDLSEFVSACKFGMMTTRDGSSGMLVSRCMALAAKVKLPSTAYSPSRPKIQPANTHYRKAAASTSSFTPTPSPARRMSCSPTRTSTSPS
jgi:hypothetical protein